MAPAFLIFYVGGIGMKYIRLALTVSVLLASLSGVALADCDDDCDGPFQTCINICRQTTKSDTPEVSTCVNNCFHGVAGCQKKCAAERKKKTGTNCIDLSRPCVLNGTPCCAPYSCKQNFPIPVCQ